MLATYDLEKQPTTFDFVHWIVNALTHGATEVSFANLDRIQTRKYPEKVALARLQNILIPICQLAGVPVVEGAGRRFSYYLWDCPKSGHWRFPYSLKYQHETVTLRDYPRNEHRNSNRAAWLRFAKEIGAVVIEEYAIKPISIAERFDLYQCRMNWFVDNGPAGLLFYSDAPYAVFGMKMTSFHEKMGMYEGYQFPWAKKNQQLIWQDDTYENIKESYMAIFNTPPPPRSNMQPTAPAKQPLEAGKVRLTLRLDYEKSKAGDTIDVEEGTAQALVNQGIAKRN